MQYIISETHESYDVGMLFKSTLMHKQHIVNYYIAPSSLDVSNYIAIEAPYNPAGKAPVKFIKTELEEILETFADLKVKVLYVCDSAYFKVLTGVKKPERDVGNVLECIIKDYEHFKVVYGIGYTRLVREPTLLTQLETSMDTLEDALAGTEVELGSNIIHCEFYPKYHEMEDTFKMLHQYPMLSCDVETRCLELQGNHIITVAFSWSQHEGVAFNIRHPQQSSENVSDRLSMLREFFTQYKGKLIYHNANFDIKVIIADLFMSEPTDYAGLLHGLDVMTRNGYHDTKIIAYCALNSTTRLDLSLKSLAQPFAGNFAEDGINDCYSMELNKLLQYNLIDTLSTWYVFNTYMPKLIEDSQTYVYDTIMLPSVKLLLQIELHGMPVNARRVGEVRKELEALEKSYSDFIYKHPEIAQMREEVMLEFTLQSIDVEKLNLTQKSLLEFNPGSSKQLGELLHERLQLPVLQSTPTGKPAVGTKVLDKLMNHIDSAETRELVQAIINKTKVSKIISTFVPVLQNAWAKGDGSSYLHGSFNLGGTPSGRLSCSNPNLQQIPSGSTYGKLIKSCFEAPNTGFVMMGADFNALTTSAFV